ncbi:tyrosine-type recombinase/integrase [Qipengyuania spongiae]|uniref:Integrase arm-type DNA-binding domain-containing protein n=1 Tax=Qipengyuania spongiae TaxID=2909673 RepID=A0ABY5SXR6_9SPHN|nr:site-specific integrase [Qipengyuania spongiae]UVI39115.1 integrase arm-type DNA-binding domain-containing protein [Qipengyuania spongiae]
MPRIAKPLAALEVSRIVHPTGKSSKHLHPVGTVPGLCLQTTAGGGRSWVLRAKVGMKRRDIGLGSYPAVPLAKAHDEARAVQKAIRSGRDPIAEKRDAKAALIAKQMRDLTFADAVDRYMETGRMAKLRHDWQREEWRTTLKTYAVPVIGSMLVGDIGLPDIKRVLAPIWQGKNATAVKVRGRIESVLAWAIDAGHRQDVANPASKGALKQWIADQGGATVTNRPSVPVDRMADWFAAAGAQEGMAAVALRFLALTAVRVDNVAGATWGEIDRKARVWTIGAHRMKGRAKDRREHRVPLSDAALALIDGLERREGVDLLFPSPRNKQLYNQLGTEMGLIHEKDCVGFVDKDSGLPAVPHGLRASFKTWGKGKFSRDLIETALAHKIGSKTEQAYDRGDALEERRPVMDAWAAHCIGGAASDDVVQLFG